MSTSTDLPNRGISSPLGPVLIAIPVIAWLLAAVAVGLRFVSRKHPQKPAADDWTILVALVLAGGMTIQSIIWTTIGGLGWHAVDLNDAQLELSLQIFYSVEVLYVFTCPIIKASILLLYRRIFDLPSFRIAVWVVGALLPCWFIGTLFPVIFQCNPIQAAWDPTLPGAVCIDAIKLFLGNGIANMLTDALILCLPIPMIWRLQLDRKRKIALSGMFLLGSFVCIASIFRIVSLLGSDRVDFTYDQAVPEIWTTLEVDIGTLCACLPTLGTLFRTWFRKRTTAKSNGSTGDMPLSAMRRGTVGYEELGSERADKKRRSQLLKGQSTSALERDLGDDRPSSEDYA